MKTSLLITTLILGISFHAHAGHKVGNGDLGNWFCAGVGNIVDKISIVKAPLFLAITKDALDLKIYTDSGDEARDITLPVNFTVINQINGMVLLKSFKDNSNQNAQAVVTIGRLSTKDSSTPGDFVISISPTEKAIGKNMNCRNYF